MEPFPVTAATRAPGTGPRLEYTMTLFTAGRVRVNGRSRHPLYAELTKVPDADGKAGKVRWNFEKFLITPAGVITRFRPTTEPDAPEIIQLIEAQLPAAS